MCTVVVSLAPRDPVPLLLLGFRDELATRPWRPPARHWPGSPLTGGLDEQAGGTWLAVHPDVPRVACILNGRGDLAPEPARRSRGELPLIAAGEGRPALVWLHRDHARLVSYDPFHLVHADVTEVTLLSWDGRAAALTRLDPGTHMITNAGLTPEDPKVRHFGAKFAAGRPPGTPGIPVAQAWHPWLKLAGGDGLPPGDPRAIRARKTLPDGRVWGTTSVSLVALGRTGLRYDFQSLPSDPAPRPALVPGG
jgi:Transport and Golgi organisation 2